VAHKHNTLTEEERRSIEIKAFSIEVFAFRNGISRSQAYKELASGRLPAVRCGGRVLITERGEKLWQDVLPRRRNPDPATTRGRRGRGPKQRTEAPSPAEPTSLSE
jgi:hypothetical protein